MKMILLISFLLLLFLTAYAQDNWFVLLNHPYGQAGWSSSSLDVLVNGSVVLDDIQVTSGGNFSLPIHFTVKDGDEITTIFNPGTDDIGSTYKILDNVKNVVAENGSWTTIPTSITTPIQGYFVETIYFTSFAWWYFTQHGWNKYNHPANNVDDTWDHTSINGFYIASGEPTNMYKLCAEVDHMVSQLSPGLYYPGILESTVSSCNIDCSEYDRVELTFRHDFHVPSNMSGCINNEIGKVKISNGNITQDYAVFNTDRTNGELYSLDITSTAAGYSNVKVHFYYYNEFYNSYVCQNNGHWLIDDVSFRGYKISERSDTCMQFDGNDDYIELPNESDYDFTNSMTLECWIKVDNFDKPWQAIVTKGDSSWRLHRSHTSNFINFVGGNASITSATEFDDNDWHHIAVVHDGPNLNMFVDGNLEASSGNASITPENDYPVMIGDNAQYMGRNFSGCLEEVRLWSSARSQSEIIENINLTLTGDEPGLVSYFQFDQYNWGRQEICDIAGFNDGTIIDAQRVEIDLPIGEGNSELISINSTGTYDFPSVGISLEINSLSSPFDLLISKIDNAPQVQPDFDDSFDSQFWILTKFGESIIDADLTFTVSESITSSDENNPANIKLFERTLNTDLDWEYYCSSISASTADNTVKFEGISDFRQFITGRSEAENQIVSLYPADDELKAYLNDELQIQFNRAIYAGTGNLHIMNSDGTLFETITVSSVIFDDETVILNPLNDFQLNSSYYILLDNDFLYNSYGNGFEISDAETWNFHTRNVESSPGHCLYLDGVNDYIQIDECVIPASGDFTISLWVKADSDQTGYREIISQNAGNGGEDFYIGRSDAGYFRLGDNWTNTGVLFPLDGKWHYLTVVKTSDDAKFYLDCYMSAANTNSILNPAGNEFRFGRQYGNHEEYFQGWIDEVKVWNIALDHDDIVANMNLTLTGIEAGLSSYYQFYESTNDRIIDLVNSRNSSLNSALKIESSIPVGTGTSFTQEILNLISYEFTGTGIEIFPTYMEAPSIATINKIESIPNIVPDVDVPFSSQYWINYESVGFDGITTFYPLEDLTIEDQNDPDGISLFVRSLNSESPFQYITSASSIDAAANSVTFDVNNYHSQLFLGRANQTTIVSSLSPYDGENEVLSDTDLTLTFNRNVLPDNPTITIYNYNDDTIFETIDLTIDNFNENVVTIEKGTNFSSGSHYYIHINNDAFINLYGNYFQGFYNKDDWDFTVKTADGYAGGCFSGDQYDAGLIVQPDETLLIPNALTFETWFYGDGDFYPNVGGTCFFNFGNISNGPKLEFRFGDKDFVFSHSNCTPGYSQIFWPDFQYYQWYHIAVTYDGQFVKLYIDGEEHGSNAVIGTFATPNEGLCIGIDYLYYTYALQGSMDEIRLWNIARTEVEIRENMHITLQGNETGLVSYWQMNEIVEGNFIDVVNANDAHIEWDGEMEESSAPIGGGSSNTHIVNSSGFFDFTGTDLSMEINSINSENSIVVSKIENQPNLDPVIDEPFNSQYWIVNSYGDGFFDADVTFTLSEVLNLQDEQNPADIQLFQRTSTANGDWIYLMNAVSIDALDNEATFSGLTDFSQFIVGRFVGSIDTPANVSIQVADNSIQISWDEVTGAASYIIFAADEPDGTYIDVTNTGNFEVVDIVSKRSPMTTKRNVRNNFSDDTSRSVQTWTCDVIGSTNKFFYIVASTDQQTDSSKINSKIQKR